ncbi:MAG TPA: protein kinase [Gammaproteobacteria bacterium]|nr:protein kinase [Gammaproteobacteria bacterium]
MTDADKTRYRPRPRDNTPTDPDAKRLAGTAEPGSAEPADDATRLKPSASGLVPEVQTGGSADYASSRERPAAEPPLDATRLQSAGGPSRPRTGAPTGPSWGDPAQWAGEDSRALQPGEVVKERFVLEDIIGTGGMGVVFRARDLRKVEAQDRHPYVALKVLNAEFKQHPESLKALQREARKAQNLAHPNIVTVYDFDRDAANVFMVMELLEGEPLDRFIRNLGGKGLSLSKALPIIRALCRALAYAHEHEVVHSDFKPANVYVTKGAVKVFDFGIARAAKHQGELDEAEDKTLFDAGTLGALTPTYASCEMIDGSDPDPRDDLYALGCVSYELLAGRHPFDRKPATQARDAKLKPAPIRGLTRRQWRCLRRALAFDRSARLGSAAKFLEEISPEKRSPALWLGSAAAVLVVGASVALLVPQYLQQRHAKAIAALVASGAPDSIEQALPQIEALPAASRAALLLDDTLRSKVIAHFNALIEAATDGSKQQYDYPQAESYVARLEQLFPDSQAVAQIGTELMTRKNDEIKRQSDLFDEYLRKGWLAPQQNPQNISAVLKVIAAIDPKHPLLNDPRLPSAYAEQAEAALQRTEVPLAKALVTAGLAFAPADDMLTDLRDRVNREVDSQQRAARLTEVKQSLAQRLPKTPALADFASAHDDLSVLQSLSPADPELKSLRSSLQTLLERGIGSLTARQAYDNAQKLLAQYADVLAPGYVELRRAALESARTKNHTASQSAAIVAGLEAQLDALLEAPSADDRWDVQVSSQLAKLSAWLAPSDAYLGNAKRKAANAHVGAAAKLLAQLRLSEAQRALQQAAAYAPSLASLQQEQQSLTQLRERRDAQLAERKRLAELAALRQKLLDQATANKVDEAVASLSKLKTGLPAGDAFLKTQAPKAIAAAYVRLAGIAAGERHFDTAVARLDRALELEPQNAEAAGLRESYAKESAALDKAARAKQAAAATAAKAAKTRERATNAAAGQPGGGAAVSLAASTPAVRTGTCSPALAGYGTRSRGVCFDTLPGGRGPELVVVPAGGSFTQPFAISRYEISVGEYDAFCKQAGKCRGSSADADLPVTSIAVADAEHYVAWLSSATGFTYRLPTDAEWLYAANAPGSSKERNFNCVVKIGGQQIRGFGLLNIRSGRPNAWGLYNQVGNAQEWVRTAKGWQVRGGAFSDPISECGTDVVRASTGAADAGTGFRIVRELR